MLIGDIPPQKHWLTLLTPLLQVCSNSGRRHFFFRVNPMRNCAFNGIPLISGWWFGTWLYFSLFSIYWEKVSQVNFIFFREVEFTNQLLLCMYTSIHPIICIYIYIIVLYVYICIYNRVLRTKWLMMVRYASETWVNIHVSYCWCGLDPWDQHLCCFHHQSHLDTDAGAVGLWSFSKPQTNITLKHILNDTV